MYKMQQFTAHSCKSALKPPVVYSTDRSKAVVPVLVLRFVASWFILRGDLFKVLPGVIFFFCFSVLLALRLPRLGKRELILMFFVRLFDLRLFALSVFSSSWCLGRAAACDCGTLWLFLLPFFFIHNNFIYHLTFVALIDKSSKTFILILESEEIQRVHTITEQNF